MKEVVSFTERLAGLGSQRGSVGRGHIRVDGVTISFGSGRKTHQAVMETNLDIRPGEFVCILGPSGCGKSTLLSSIAGYVRPSTGEVLVDDAPVRGPGPERGMVFQQYSLFPWKTIAENIVFGPKVAGRPKAECAAIAATFLEMVGLTKFANAYPAELSGGMQQRVGIARALANSPSVLLMDEPFGALDAQTRLMMQESLLEIWSAFGITVVFVTHDVDEAIFLADRIVIMSASPGSVIADLKVTLPRPRSSELATSEAFMGLKRACHEAIRAESLRAFAQQSQ
ncbi:MULTISPECIES: ABC transporter ATP-binding protein [unclassified Xanthobacter]|uniref:ABC transporter ATP-binding protein n=1 Tax=unclassified Xanthobacter TaxID=2623496 RepID=UPI001EDFC933|nr:MULTISPECIES: ABC transporter ATP-binding protein [unclassified Xanthobacter]